jgi:hypothetical protein
MESLSRNSTEGFARRVRRNLEFIIDERGKGTDVHEVTQLVVSLLGFVVFPWEANALKRLDALTLEELERDGWPQWRILLDERGDTSTLGKLTWHLRNAASHRRIAFSSDDPSLQCVTITFEDARNYNSPTNWRASISGTGLREFCDRLGRRLEELVG